MIDNSRLALSIKENRPLYSIDITYHGCPCFSLKMHRRDNNPSCAPDGNKRRLTYGKNNPQPAYYRRKTSISFINYSPAEK